ncbi:MAG: hypothetical protein HY391_05415 [Deltaproteobacteria bacterium]|nr:hypothetical protein [Deltaproteobacteria bacterium]
MNPQNLVRTIVVGVVCTAVMSGFALFAPLFGVTPANVPNLVAMTFGLTPVIGWVAFFVMGCCFALIYGLCYNILPLQGVMKGITYGVFPWLVTQMVMMPMMGIGFFSGSMGMALGSLIGYVLFGCCLGYLYRPLLVMKPAQ